MTFDPRKTSVDFAHVTRGKRYRSEAKSWKTDASTIELRVELAACRKVKVQNVHRYKRTPTCTTNIDLARSFTMAGLAGDYALRGERCASRNCQLAKQATQR